MRDYLELTARGQVARLRRVAAEAVRAHGLPVGPMPMLAHGENTTFRLDAPSGRVLVRVHRHGYHSPNQIESELAWLAALGTTGLGAPVPRRYPDGRGVQVFGGAGLDAPRAVTVLRWVEGRHVARGAGGARLYRALGALMAGLHAHARAWSRPPEFERVAWDGPLTGAPHWGDALALPGLDDTDRAMITQGLAAVRRALAAAPRGPDDWGLVHADLHTKNVLWGPSGLVPLDFDDCGFGWFAYDLAVPMVDLPARPAERLGWMVAGYETVRPLPPRWLALVPTLITARVLSLAAWLVSRSDNPALAAHHAVVRERLRRAVPAYLSGALARALGVP